MRPVIVIGLPTCVPAGGVSMSIRWYCARTSRSIVLSTAPVGGSGSLMVSWMRPPSFGTLNFTWVLNCEPGVVRPDRE